MKLVILDGHALNPGDLSWEALSSQVGDFVLYPRTAPEQVVERIGDAELVLTNKTVLDETVLARTPSVRYIGELATGVNNIDLSAARARGIAVTNVPAYSTASVAQMTFALLLELTLQAGHYAQLVHSGAWARSADFSFFDTPLVELEGLQMGIVGFGQIGRRVARLAQGFGMRVAVHTAHPEKYREAYADLEFLELEPLLRESDVVSLHCPLTPETRQMIDARRIALMKPTAYLINSGRGPLVDERALADALKAGRIAGLGVDVLSSEPPSADNPLCLAPHCVITPHIAWATRAARLRLMAVAADNLRAFLRGEPLNRVDGA